MNRVASVSNSSQSAARFSAKAVRGGVPPSGRSSPARLALGVGFILLVWSFNFIVGKVGLRELPPVALASFRIVIAGLAMVPVLLFAVWKERRRAKEAPTAEPNPLALRPSRRDIWRFAYLGFFGVVINNGFFTVGLNYTSVGHSSLIVGSAPILVLLMAWAARMEQLTARKIAGLALAFTGAVVLGRDQAANLQAGWQGDLMALTAVLGFSLYTVLAKRLASAYQPMHVNVYTNMCAGLLVFPVALWQLAEIAQAEGIRSVGWQGWVAALYMGVLASAICFWLYFWALRSMAASRLASMNYLQPLGATLLGITLLGERLTSHFMGGGLLVFAGLFAIQSGRGTMSRAKS